MVFVSSCLGEVFDYLVAHGRMREKEARVKFRQVCLSNFCVDQICDDFKIIVTYV